MDIISDFAVFITNDFPRPELIKYSWKFPQSSETKKDGEPKITGTMKKWLETCIEKPFLDKIPSDCPDCDELKILELRHIVSQEHITLDTYILTNFVIKVWGGIRHNDVSKIKSYARAFNKDDCKSPIDKLSQPVPLSNQKKVFQWSPNSGISSWSKVLATADPQNYFVYDARIDAILRLLWHFFALNKSLSEADFPFSTPSKSSNNRVQFIFDLLDEKLPSATKQDIEPYLQYCNLIKLLASPSFNWIDKRSSKVLQQLTDLTHKNYSSYETAVRRQLVEMTLFAILGNDRPVLCKKNINCKDKDERIKACFKSNVYKNAHPWLKEKFTQLQSSNLSHPV